MKRLTKGCRRATREPVITLSAWTLDMFNVSHKKVGIDHVFLHKKGRQSSVTGLNRAGDGYIRSQSLKFLRN